PVWRGGSCAYAPAEACAVVLMVQVSARPYKARVRGLLGKDTVLPHEKASRVVAPGLQILHLRQRCFGLWQPEGHLHRLVQREGSGERGTGQLPLTCLRIQQPKAALAVRLERAHAQLLGQGEGLAVVADGGLALWERLARRALTQQPQGPGLVVTLLVLTGEVESLCGALARLF